MAKAHRSLKGRLLLDGGKLAGSYFHRSVVLICQHDREGAFGLVLNKPSENRLRDVLSGELPESILEEVLYGGGPVQPAALSFLHSDFELEEGNVLANLRVGHELEDLRRIAEGVIPSRQLRIFAGYAGWSGGQLDEEMRRGAWLQRPASLDLVFHAEPERLWSLILRQSDEWQERLLADTPEDLSWN